MFLSLLATWLLFLLIRARTPRPWLEAGYIASVIAGALTAEPFWLLVVIHLCWAMLVLPWKLALPEVWSRQIGFFKVPRLIQTQTIAIILAAPAISHSIYRARKGVGQGLSDDFLMEYFSFGFLFAKDDLTIPTHHAGAVGVWFLLAFALILLVAGLKAPKREAPLFALGQSLPPRLPIISAVVSTALMLWLALIAQRRTEDVIALTVLPLMASGIPVLTTIWRNYVPRLPSGALHFVQERAIFLWLVAVVSPLILFAAYCKAPTLAPASFMIFVPYYLILCAAGAVWMFRRRTFRWIIISLTIIVFAASVPYVTGQAETPDNNKDSAQATHTTVRAD
ncbi:hypothetical protein [Roseovarius arcticus]|uniref:hypothetical protein n=1 Tax=Roseovarius arcticus TaxID=2547404 RepID=UPI001110E6DB|nr:hypothetical protein [Roseovarius arcticus]